ncbi:acyl-CoA dehydrogenase family protein [Amycolatopsis jejuensis]|uniref:acyl-CoA dehydrogenase family protein n=1 Tax=Amycolatopsis jejuensis TaxID=330084 RepID=UPI00068F7898|nr:acyl-CoA dehydrogenase family protein [Amycolatopsis jejuensis]
MTLTETEPATEALEQARALHPILAGRAPDVDTLGRVPKESMDALRSTGLLTLQKPRRFGGPGGSLSTALRVSRELGSACLSTAWLHGVLSGDLLFVSLFPLEVQEEVYADPSPVVASVIRTGGGQVTPVKGGFRVQGVEGRFCSGVEHSGWVVIGHGVEGPEGRLYLLPRSDVRTLDDWQTAGMRGTESKSIRIEDAFVPEARALPAHVVFDGTAPGAAALGEPYYQRSLEVVAPYTLVGAALGGGFAAIEAARTALAGRIGGASADRLPPREEAIAVQIAASAQQLEAAYAHVLNAAEALDADPGRTDLSALELAHPVADCAFAAQTARKVVNDVFAMSGGSAIYNSSPIQRWWRDVNCACQHVYFTWYPAITRVGRVMVQA